MKKNKKTTQPNNIVPKPINGIKLKDASFYSDRIYTIIEGGEQVGEAKISFVNGEFHRCAFPFSGNYSREQWKILALLAAEIEKIYLSKNL